MALKIQLNRADYLEYYLYFASKSPETWKGRNKWWIGLTLAGFALSILCYALNYPVPIIPILAITVINAFTYPKYFKKAVNKGYQKYVDNLSLGDEYVFDIDNEGITHSGTTIYTKIYWLAIKQVTETSNYFYLSYGNDSTLVIPKRVILGTPIIEQFLKFIETNKIILQKDLDWKWS